MKSVAHTLAGVFSPLGLLPDAAADSSPRCTASPRKGPRRREVEAQFAADLARAFAYQAQRTTNPEAMAALEREYDHRLAAGPDFTRHRGKSHFGPPPPHRLDGNALARVWARFNTFDRQSYNHRQPGKHRGLITRTCREVFSALIALAKQHKLLFPSLLCLARMARCSKQSVVTALDMLERLGFITRHRRLKLVETMLGRKAEQDTNGYELHDPNPAAMAVKTPPSARHESESNSWAATVPVSLSYLKDYPETWGSPGIAQCNAYGGPPKAGHF